MLCGLILVMTVVVFALVERSVPDGTKLSNQDLRPNAPPVASIHNADVELEQRTGKLVAMSWIVDETPVHTPVPIEVTSNRKINISDDAFATIEIHSVTPPDMLLVSISTSNGEHVSELVCRYETIVFADQPTHCEIMAMAEHQTSRATIPLPPERLELLIVVQGIWYMTIGAIELTPDPRMPVYTATWAFALRLQAR